jgi:hypothetical protein
VASRALRPPATSSQGVSGIHASNAKHHHRTKQHHTTLNHINALFLEDSPLLLRFDAFHRGRNTHRMTRQSPSARKRHLSLILFYSPLLHSRNPCSCRGEPALLLNLCGEDPSPPSLNNSHRSAHVDRQPSSIPHPLVPSRSSALPLVSFLGTFFGRRSAFLGTVVQACVSVA